MRGRSPVGALLAGLLLTACGGAEPVRLQATPVEEPAQMARADEDAAPGRAGPAAAATASEPTPGSPGGEAGPRGDAGPPPSAATELRRQRVPDDAVDDRVLRLTVGGHPHALLVAQQDDGAVRVELARWAGREYRPVEAVELEESVHALDRLHVRVDGDGRTALLGYRGSQGPRMAAWRLTEDGLAPPRTCPLPDGELRLRGLLRDWTLACEPGGAEALAWRDGGFAPPGSDRARSADAQDPRPGPSGAQDARARPAERAEPRDGSASSAPGGPPRADEHPGRRDAPGHDRGRGRDVRPGRDGGGPPAHGEGAGPPHRG